MEGGSRSIIGRKTTGIIITLAIIGGLSLFGVLSSLGGGGGSTGTNTLTTYASATSHSTPLTTSGDLKELLRELAGEARSKEVMGYDVLYAKYLLLSAKYYYGEGDTSKAYELLKEAEKELENAELLPELPLLNFTIADNTLHLRRVPGVWDFVPIGTVFVLTDRGYLNYPRNDPMWKLSCFIIIAVGNSSDGEWFGYQGRLPLKPREGLFKPRIYLGGEWRILDTVFAGPLYYDDGERFGYPTVYQYDLSGNIMQYLMYIPENRTWKHEIIDLRSDVALLSITAKAVGTPMWLGEWNKTYLPHGVYSELKGIDLWSAFWDMAVMNATIRLDSVEKEFTGFLVFDRASHRVYEPSGISPSIDNATPLLPEDTCQCRFPSAFGLPLAFSCMVIYQDGLTIMVASSVNPSPWNPFPLQHQLRINLLDENITIDTADFHLEDDGTLQPKVFRLWGEFEGGYFNLTGRVVNFWPSRWVIGRGTWWSSNGTHSWGRAFIEWTGEILINGRVIEVNAFGVGEFTRYTD